MPGIRVNLIFKRDICKRIVLRRERSVAMFLEGVGLATEIDIENRGMRILAG